MIVSRIRRLAEKRGLKNANQLKDALGVSPTLAARLWGERFTQIGLTTLDRLCREFKCQPADLLKYTPEVQRKRRAG